MRKSLKPMQYFCISAHTQNFERLEFRFRSYYDFSNLIEDRLYDYLIPFFSSVREDELVYFKQELKHLASSYLRLKRIDENISLSYGRFFLSVPLFITFSNSLEND